MTDYVIDGAMDLFMELDELGVLLKDLMIIQKDGFVIWKVHVQHYLIELSYYRSSVVQELGAELKSVRAGMTAQGSLLHVAR